MNDIKPTDRIPAPAYYIDPQREDEISLVDLFIVLAKRKMTILLVLLACTGLAVIATFFIGEKVTYATTINLGTGPETQSNDTALVKIRETYIPVTKNAVANDAELRGLKVEARAPDGGNLVILDTQTGPENKMNVEQLHSQVAEQFMLDYEQQLDQKRGIIENQIERLRTSLTRLKNSTYLISLRDSVAELRSQYLGATQLSDVRRQAVKDELRFLQTKLLEEEQSVMTQTINLQSKIDQLQTQLDNFPKPTLGNIALKTDSNQRSSLLVIALGIILGGMLGIFAAFVLEFLNKVKQAQQHSTETEE